MADALRQASSSTAARRLAAAVTQGRRHRQAHHDLELNYFTLNPLALNFSPNGVSLPPAGPMFRAAFQHQDRLRAMHRCTQPWMGSAPIAEAVGG